MGDASPLQPSDKCPCVTAPDGTHCVETADIMRFVGQRVGLAPPADSAADQKAMKMCLLAQTCINQCFYPLMKPMTVRHIFNAELLGACWWARRFIVGAEAGYLPGPTAKLGEILDEMEACVTEGGGLYVCGAHLTYADVALFAVLREVLDFSCFDADALLAARPKCAALMKALETHAGAQEWLEKRTREHQLGIRGAVPYFAATNTPFPWSRQKK